MTNTLLHLAPEVCLEIAPKYPAAHRSDIEDCFMRAVELLHEEPDIPQKPEAWVRTATEFLLRNELRKTGRNVRASDHESELSQCGTESQVCTNCDVELMFGMLKESYAQIIRLHDVEGLTIEEIAAKQQKSVAAVYKTYERAIAKARHILTKMGYARGGGDDVIAYLLSLPRV